MKYIVKITREKYTGDDNPIRMIRSELFNDKESRGIVKLLQHIRNHFTNKKRGTK